MAFNLFPFTNLHNLNTDWILKTIKELKTAAETAASQVQEALANAVLYTSQSKDVMERKIACRNIHAVSFDGAFGMTTEESLTACNHVHAVSYYSDQSLTDQQKAKARTNIGALSSSDIPSVTGVVSYEEAQTLTDAQKLQARSNIGAASASDVSDIADAIITVGDNLSTLNNTAVKTVAQTLNDTQKAQARTNIGAISAADIPPAASAVLYTSQSLTTGQQVQARTNIRAAYDADVYDLEMIATYDIQITETATDTFVISNSATLNDAGYAYTHGGVVTVSIDTLLDGYLRGIASFSSDDYGNLVAFLSSIKTPGVSESAGYMVQITNNGTDDVLTVTPFSFKLMPTCQILDAGKSLTVQGNGAPDWEQIKPITVQDTVSTTPTIASAADNTIYKFTQDLTSLSLTAGSGSYMICFHSGSTPTTTSFPVSILGLDDFVPEAKTYYEINIMDGRAVWMGWADPVEE